MNPFKIGDVVTVCGNLSKTKDFYGVTEEMRELARNNDGMIVKHADEDSVKANGWCWHFTDLVYAKPFTLENE